MFITYYVASSRLIEGYCHVCHADTVPITRRCYEAIIYLLLRGGTLLRDAE